MDRTIELDEQQVKLVVEAVVSRLGTERSELVGILHALSDELGYLPPQAFVEIGRLMGLPVGEVYSVASFYTMLFTEPRGRHLVLVCESAPCHVAGGQALIDYLPEILGVQVGGTSTDNRWTLLKTSCLGQCAQGPILVIDDELYGNVSKESLPDILKHYK